MPRLSTDLEAWELHYLQGSRLSSDCETISLKFESSRKQKRHLCSWGSGRRYMGFGRGGMWGSDGSFQAFSSKPWYFDSACSWDHCQNFYDLGTFWLPVHQGHFPWHSLAHSSDGLINISPCMKPFLPVVPGVGSSCCINPWCTSGHTGWKWGLGASKIQILICQQIGLLENKCSFHFTSVTSS